MINEVKELIYYRTINTKIASNLLSKVVIDKYNNKWIGSIDHGLMKFDGKDWTSYENAGILNSSRINDILIDSKDRMWVATSFGLSSFDGITWQSYDDKLPSRTVTALEEDPSGNIWIGTDNGLVKYNNSSFQIFTSANSGFPENNITCIAAGKNGDIWLGTGQSGIFSFINNKWNFYKFIEMDLSENGKISNFIVDIIFDKNGTLWSYHKGIPSSETRDALLKCNSLNWSEFSLPLQFPVEVVSFNADTENNIWISAKEGFVKYNETIPIKMFNTFDYGFYAKHCTSSCVDKNGDVWITTMGGGLIKLKKANF